MATFPLSHQQSMITSPPLSVVIAVDMKDCIKPVMFPFEVATAPIQLKLLQVLGEMLEISRTGSFDHKQKRNFKNALDRARLVASNSAFNAMIKPHLGSAKPNPERALEPREGTRDGHSRTNFTSRHKRAFSRQGTPQVNLDVLFRKVQSEGIITEEEESDEEQAPSLSARSFTEPACPQEQSGTQNTVEEDEGSELPDPATEDEDVFLTTYMKQSSSQSGDHGPHMPSNSKSLMNSTPQAIKQYEFSQGSSMKAEPRAHSSDEELLYAIPPECVPSHQSSRLPQASFHDVDHDPLGKDNGMQEGTGTELPLANEDHTTFANDVTTQQADRAELNAEAEGLDLLLHGSSWSTSSHSSESKIEERTPRRSRRLDPVGTSASFVSVGASASLVSLQNTSSPLPRCSSSVDGEVLAKDVTTHQDDGAWAMEDSGSNDGMAHSKGKAGIVPVDFVRAPVGKAPSRASTIRSSMRARSRSISEEGEKDS